MDENVRDLHAALVEAAALGNALAGECAEIARQLHGCGNASRAEAISGVGRALRIKALQMSAAAGALVTRDPHVLAPEAGRDRILGRGSMSSR